VLCIRHIDIEIESRITMCPWAFGAVLIVIDVYYCKVVFYHFTSKPSTNLLLVSIAQHVALGVEEVTDGDRGRKGSHVDFEIGSNIGAGCVSRGHLAADFMEAGG
jgi:hypothetical protein